MEQITSCKYEQYTYSHVNGHVTEFTQHCGNILIWHMVQWQLEQEQVDESGTGGGNVFILFVR